MASEEEQNTAVLAALETEAQIELRRFPVSVHMEGGSVTLKGAVADITAKRKAVHAAHRITGRVVVDSLTVVPAEPMGDGVIRNHLQDALLGEGAFSVYELRMMQESGAIDVLRAPKEPQGGISFAVSEGRVHLQGRAGSPSHRRLAGVLAWWIPGVVDVENTIEVVPPRPDDAGELEESVRLVLEKDQLVDSGQITVFMDEGCLVLGGNVGSESQRRIAEHDAWYVDGVEAVDNRLNFI